MKKLYFLLFLLISIFSNAQIVTIPNANFKSKLLSANIYNGLARDISGNFIAIDANGDGEIQVTEAQNVYLLNVDSANISNLTGIQSFTNVRNLYCSNNLLTSLNLSGMTNLLTIDCSSNDLISLDISTLTTLKELDCSLNNTLTSLTFGTISAIEKLDCSWSSISTLDLSHLTNLQELECGLNRLTALNVSANARLRKLGCSQNQLSSLDVTNLAQLQLLFCDRNHLSELDLTNSINLTSLYCPFNQLVTLNLNSLNNLQSINCGANPLTSLNISGMEMLYNLVFSNTEIAAIDLSGLTNLQTLQCSSIPSLTSLDLSDSINLFDLTCIDNTNLTSLIIKNGRIESTLRLELNPNLRYICVDENQINEVQSLANSYGYTNCQVNSYCSFVPGGIVYTIEGTTRLDENSNGCDPFDTICPNFKFNITDGVNNGSLITNTSGNSSITVPAGAHTITPVLENPTYFSVSPSTAAVTFPTSNSPYQQNFCVTSNGIRNDVEVVLIPLTNARPGFDANYKIVYKNKGNQTQSGTINLTFNDSILDLVSANPLNDGLSTNTLSWSFVNLHPFKSREILVAMNINSPTETPAVISGDVLNYTATIIGASDETANDNTFNLNQIVRNSFDPNDKTCLEGTIIAPEMIGDYVHYMIRFENTGTFAAQNVVIKDFIDTNKFDIVSLIPISSSHNFVTKISSTNKVEFIFENINLPFNDANNDGYVAFKIKTKPTLVIGDTFSNNASIYFDYNFPIVTNTASTVVTALGSPDFEFSDMFSLSPVPAKDYLTIVTKQEVSITSVIIYNTLGQLVQVNANPNEIIDVSGLKTGNYFIKIISDKGTANSKFIKD